MQESPRLAAPLPGAAGAPALAALPAAPAGLAWAERWARLAHGVGLTPDAPVAVALSGGADSVLLLALLAESEARPPLLAIHVEHGLRAAESEDDARFCSRLCARVGVPLVRRPAPLDAGSGNLEARAREARYRVLGEVARTRGFGVVATGHHADDALETVLLRLLRGTELGGLGGVARERGPAARVDAPELRAELRVVHPLLDLRREEVRHLLRTRDIPWRQDSSNRDPRFTRNRVRHGLLPWIERHASAQGVESLRRFAASVEGFEEACAARTAELAWRAPRHGHAVRGPGQMHLGGRVERALLERLPAALLRRVLSRLLVEGTGRRPRGATLDELVHAFERHGRLEAEIVGGWRFVLGARELALHPPEDLLATDPRGPDLPFQPSEHELALADGIPLAVPGTVALRDGRRVLARPMDGPARWARRDGSGLLVPESPRLVRLDASLLELPLRVRAARPGDRFHGLGAPGSRPLGRFLRDAGVASADRRRVPLVISGSELVWVAGIRPAERFRVRADSARCVELELTASAR